MLAQKDGRRARAGKGNAQKEVDCSRFTTQAFWWMIRECLENFPPHSSHTTVLGGGIGAN